MDSTHSSVGCRVSEIKNHGNGKIGRRKHTQASATNCLSFLCVPETAAMLGPQSCLAYVSTMELGPSDEMIPFDLCLYSISIDFVCLIW